MFFDYCKFIFSHGLCFFHLHGILWIFLSFVLIVSSLLFFVSGFSSSFGFNVFFPVLSFFRFFLNIIFVFCLFLFCFFLNFSFLRNVIFVYLLLHFSADVFCFIFLVFWCFCIMVPQFFLCFLFLSLFFL